MTSLLTRLTSALLLLVSVACGPAGGSGSVVVSITGEDAVREGLGEHDDGHGDDHDHPAFVDGWHVHFDKYVVSFGRLSLRGTDGSEAFASDALFVADLHKGDVEVARLDALPAQRWDDFSFELAPPGDGVTNLNGVAQDDIDRLAEAGANYLVAGTAHRGDEEVSFEWLLKIPTRNAACTNGDDGKQGLVVTNGGTTRATITLHVEHLFWDTLGSESTPNMRFDAIAAMADADGFVDFDALASQPLAQPLDAEGQPLKDLDGSPVIYDPGSVTLPAPGLQGLILASAATQAHLNGEGLCTISSLR